MHELRFYRRCEGNRTWPPRVPRWNCDARSTIRSGEAVEIGDIVDTPEEAAPGSRKRQGHGARNSARNTTTESSDETGTRKRNGRRALTRRRNGNGSRGDVNPVLRNELETL